MWVKYLSERNGDRAGEASALQRSGAGNMKRKGLIEVLARGVCVKDGRLLVCHTRGASNTYLPGGHVEFLEKARDALTREIEEEMGLAARIGRFLGGVEHTFVQKGERHSEMNLVFEMSIDKLLASETPPSREGHIDFRWAPLSALACSDLEPYTLRGSLVEWLGEGDGADRWASTLP